MRFHMKKCGKEKRFQCEICQKRFTSKYAWQRHKVVFHLEENLTQQEVQTMYNPENKDCF